MKRRVVLLAIVPMLLSFAICGVQPTQSTGTDTSDFIFGVNVGDWVKYSVTASWASNGSSSEPPPDFIELQKVEWIKNTVLTISGTHITFERRIHSEDGNETESVEYIDIETGASSEMGTLVFIAAGLAKDDVIHASTTEDYRINETITRTYLGVTRVTNHLNVSTVYYDPFTGDVMLTTANYYWDKTTGILCERPGAYSSYSGNTLTSLAVNEKIIDTNLWEPNMPADGDADFPSAIIVAISVVAIGFLAFLLLWRYKGKKSKPRKN